MLPLLISVPLLMIWLNYSWQIILFGVYLTYSYEHVDDFDPDKDELFNRRRNRRLQKRNERRQAVRKAAEAMRKQKEETL